MLYQILEKTKSTLSTVFPERRIFLRTDTETRFLRLKPSSQAIAIFGAAILVGWSIMATAILLMDSIGSGNFREQAKRDQQTYQERLDYLASERDFRAKEALAAQNRFNLALDEVSNMQASLIASEIKREELRRGLVTMQNKLQTSVEEYELVEQSLGQLTEQINEKPGSDTTNGPASPDNVTLSALTALLERTATERDTLRAETEAAHQRSEQIELEKRLMSENNLAIFKSLEDALTVSMEPLDKMFSAAGLNTKSLLKQVRKGYAGYGGPLSAVAASARQGPSGGDFSRSAKILNDLDQLNLYRMAAEKLPFSMPVKGSYRHTSGFGRRWGRMHRGTDFAAVHGAPIYATGDGVITYAGWQSGYGRIVKIQHEFGIETRYAHMSKIRVKKGQRVSRGHRIGDMGNTGRSTGTHLHYEVRVNGEAVNPMIYIKAGKNVF